MFYVSAINYNTSNNKAFLFSKLEISTIEQNIITSFIN